MNLRSAIALCALVGLIGGCQRQNVHDQQPIGAPFQLASEVQASQPLLRAAIYSSAESTIQADVVDDAGAIIGERVLTRRPTTDYHATFVDAEGDREATYWTINEGGNAVMTAHIDFKDRALSLFNPPLTIAFAELAPGEERTSESSMRVMDLNNPRKLKEIGRAVRTMKYVTDRQVLTRAGTSTARQIEIVFEAKLRLATAVERRTVFLTDDEGWIAETRRTDVKVLGAFSTSTSTQLVLRYPQLPK